MKVRCEAYEDCLFWVENVEGSLALCAEDQIFLSQSSDSFGIAFAIPKSVAVFYTPLSKIVSFPDPKVDVCVPLVEIRRAYSQTSLW